MKIRRILFALLLLLCFCQCEKKQNIAADKTKVWAWLSGKLSYTNNDWDYYFGHAADAGIDAILLECHNGYPDTTMLTDDFVDAQAIKIIQTAVPYAKKYGIELHAWMWTENRCERNLRKLHPEWYMINKNGESCNDIKLYNREHYRFLCSYQNGVIEYLKQRAAELAKIDGLSGVHLDFIRFPDVILPAKLQPSRGVVQDKEYPLWDCCYCDSCVQIFKRQTGIDITKVDDPSQCAEWKQFRYDGITKAASSIAAEIKVHGKIASAAVFPHPDTARKLVRQEWSRWQNFDYLFPMTYHKMYTDDDNWIATATTAGITEMRKNNNAAKLCTGLFWGHLDKNNLYKYFKLALNAGSEGICIFSLEALRHAENKGSNDWQKLKEAISELKNSKQ